MVPVAPLAQGTHPGPLHRRESQALSVRGESIPEERFYRSLCRAVGMWPGARLVDYVCVESALLGESPAELPESPQKRGQRCPELCWPSGTLLGPGLPAPSGAGGRGQL